MFLRLGLIGFGGPAAHIAMMREELVRRRGWVDDQRFVDLMGATNLIPGPNSTELAIHLGWDRGRRRGLLVAGVCFILPAAVLVTALAWGYVRYGATPVVRDVLYGVVPAVVAVIVWAAGRAWSARSSRTSGSAGCVAARAGGVPAGRQRAGRARRWGGRSRRRPGSAGRWRVCRSSWRRTSS